MLFEVTGRDRRPLFVAVRIGKSPRLVPKLTQKASWAQGRRGKEGSFEGSAKNLPASHGSTGQARFGQKRPGTWQKEPSLRGGFVGLGTLWNSWPRFKRRALVAKFQAGESGSHNSGGNREEQAHRLKCYVEDSRAQKTGMLCH